MGSSCKQIAKRCSIWWRNASEIRGCTDLTVDNVSFPATPSAAPPVSALSWNLLLRFDLELIGSTAAAIPAARLVRPSSRGLLRNLNVSAESVTDV
jgi:hypothetical protein